MLRDVGATGDKGAPRGAKEAKLDLVNKYCQDPHSLDRL